MPSSPHRQTDGNITRNPACMYHTDPVTSTLCQSSSSQASEVCGSSIAPVVPQAHDMTPQYQRLTHRTRKSTGTQVLRSGSLERSPLDRDLPICLRQQWWSVVQLKMLVALSARSLPSACFDWCPYVPRFCRYNMLDHTGYTPDIQKLSYKVYEGLI